MDSFKLVKMGREGKDGEEERSRGKIFKMGVRDTRLCSKGNVTEGKVKGEGKNEGTEI